MPIFTIPTHDAFLQEYNSCHTPSGGARGGQFCSDLNAVQGGIDAARGRGNAARTRRMEARQKYGTLSDDERRAEADEYRAVGELDTLISRKVQIESREMARREARMERARKWQARRKTT